MEHGVLHHTATDRRLCSEMHASLHLCPRTLFFHEISWPASIFVPRTSCPSRCVHFCPPTHFFLTRFPVGNLQAILSRREREDGGRTGGGGNGESRAQSANASNSEEQSGSRSKLWQDTVTTPNNGGGVTRLGSDSDSSALRSKVRLHRGLGFRVLVSDSDSSALRSKVRLHRGLGFSPE